MAELNHENVVKAIGFLCDDQNDILGKKFLVFFIPERTPDMLNNFFFFKVKQT